MSVAFVTGGSGFVGRALISYLVARGNEVRALARSGKAAETVRAAGATQVVEGDLRGGAVLLADGAVADVTLPPGHSTLRVGGRQKRVAMDVAPWLSELAAAGVTPNLDLALPAP